MELLTHMVTFAHVVQAGSFAGGAKRLRVSTSVASKHIAKLERSLGAKLLNRSTRTLSLTEIGSAYYLHCARIAEELDSAERAITGLQDRPSGRLRVSAPTGFLTQAVVPLLREFHRRYPEILLDFDLSNRMVDLAEEGFDVALRVQPGAPSNLVTYPLAPVRIAACASPEYAREHGLPRVPEELRNHPCVTLSSGPTLTSWTFRSADEVVPVDVQGFLTCNSVDPLRLLILEGLGIAALPTFIVGDDIRQGRLVRVLPGYELISPALLYAAHLPHRYVPPKLQCFIEYLQEQFGSPPFWDAGLFDEPALALDGP